jgi:hypothetical protein
MDDRRIELRGLAAQASRAARAAQQAVVGAHQAVVAGAGSGPSARELESERMLVALEHLAWQRYFTHVFRAASRKRPARAAPKQRGDGSRT